MSHDAFSSPVFKEGESLRRIDERLRRSLENLDVWYGLKRHDDAQNATRHPRCLRLLLRLAFGPRLARTLTLYANVALQNHCTKLTVLSKLTMALNRDYY